MRGGGGVKVVRVVRSGDLKGLQSRQRTGENEKGGGKG